MAVVSVLARLRREPLEHLPIGDRVEQLCAQCNHSWRDRLLTPLVTLRLFLLQILHGNTAIAHLRQLSGLAFAPASYCEARQRLPLEVILGGNATGTQLVVNGGFCGYAAGHGKTSTSGAGRMDLPCGQPFGRPDADAEDDQGLRGV